MSSTDDFSKFRHRLAQIAKLRKDLDLEEAWLRGQLEAGRKCDHRQKVDYIWRDAKNRDIGGFRCPQCGMIDTWGRGHWSFFPEEGK